MGPTLFKWVELDRNMPPKKKIVHRQPLEEYFCRSQVPHPTVCYFQAIFRLSSLRVCVDSNIPPSQPNLQRRHYSNQQRLVTAAAQPTKVHATKGSGSSSVWGLACENKVGLLVAPLALHVFHATRSALPCASFEDAYTPRPICTEETKRNHEAFWHRGQRAEHNLVCYR